MNFPVHCLIVSAKGGVGKSTTALGLAIAFARTGKRVLLVDCDVASRSLELFSGVSPLFHMGDMLLHRCTPDKVCVSPFSALPTLTFCAAPHRDDADTLLAQYPDGVPGAIAAGCRMLLDTEPGYDVVLWDTGSGYEIPRVLAPLAQIALVCTEQSPASIRAAAYSASLLSEVPKVRLVLCSFDMAAARRGERAGMLEMIDTCRLKCAAVIPLDPKLMRAQENGSLPDNKCTAMQAYTNLARRLEGWDVPLFTGMRHMHKKHAL